MTHWNARLAGGGLALSPSPPSASSSSSPPSHTIPDAVPTPTTQQQLDQRVSHLHNGAGEGIFFVKEIFPDVSPSSAGSSAAWNYFETKPAEQARQPVVVASFGPAEDEEDEENGTGGKLSKKHFRQTSEDSYNSEMTYDTTTSAEVVNAGGEAAGRVEEEHLMEDFMSSLLLEEDIPPLSLTGGLGAASGSNFILPYSPSNLGWSAMLAPSIMTTYQHHQPTNQVPFKTGGSHEDDDFGENHSVRTVMSYLSEDGRMGGVTEDEEEDGDSDAEYMEDEEYDDDGEEDDDLIGSASLSSSASGYARRRRVAAAANGRRRSLPPHSASASPTSSVASSVYTRAIGSDGQASGTSATMGARITRKRKSSLSAASFTLEEDAQTAVERSRESTGSPKKFKSLAIPTAIGASVPIPAAPGSRSGRRKSNNAPKAMAASAPSAFDMDQQMLPLAPHALGTSSSAVTTIPGTISSSGAPLGARRASSSASSAASSSSRSRHATSIYRGVSKCTKDGRWQARIRIQKEVVYLGRFATEVEAARVYDDAVRKHHGANAAVNFLNEQDVAYGRVSIFAHEASVRKAARVHKTAQQRLGSNGASPEEDSA